MKITFGEKSIEVRDWVGGKVLLMTRNEQVKGAMARMAEENPDAVELLTDPEVSSPEDFEDGLFSVIVDRKRAVLVFDLDLKKIGFAVYSEEEEEE